MICSNCLNVISRLERSEKGINLKGQKRSNFCILLLFGNFLKNGLITFFFLFGLKFSWEAMYQQSKAGFDWNTPKIIFRVGKVRFGHFPIIINIIQW